MLLQSKLYYLTISSSELNQVDTNEKKMAPVLNAWLPSTHQIILYNSFLSLTLEEVAKRNRRKKMAKRLICSMFDELKNAFTGKQLIGDKQFYQLYKIEYVWSCFVLFFSSFLIKLRPIILSLFSFCNYIKKEDLFQVSPITKFRSTSKFKNRRFRNRFYVVF